jgi:hypothetical protein
LIEDADAFDGKQVVVIAFADALGSALHASREDYARAKDGIRLPGRAASEKLHEKFVLVEGFFGAKLRGIGDVVRIEPWSDPTRARAKAVAPPRAPDTTSLESLIARPEEFDGKNVVAVGFASMAYDCKALYVSEEVYRNGVSKDGVWLDVTLDPRLHERYVVVEGRFDAERLGHMRMSSGTFAEIRRIDPA